MRWTRCATLVCSMLASAALWTAAADAGNCTISTSAVTFGTYNVFSSIDLTGTGRVTYNCNGNATVTITLDNGGASSCSSRRMLKGSEQLAYNLYLDAALTMIW